MLNAKNQEEFKMYTLKIIPGVEVGVKCGVIFLCLLCVVLSLAIFVDSINVGFQLPQIVEERSEGSTKKVKRRVILWSKVLWLLVLRIFTQASMLIFQAVRVGYTSVCTAYLWVYVRLLIELSPVNLEEETGADTEQTTEQILPEPLPHLPDEFEKVFRQSLEQIKQQVPEWSEVSDAEKMLQVERAIHLQCQRLADKVTALIIKERLGDEQFCKAARTKAYQRHPYMESVGKRDVHVTLLGGTTIKVKTSYIVYRPCKNKRRGRRRATGKRGKGGAGLYPALHQLGFRDRISPALQSTVARTATEVASYEIAREMLRDRGICISYKRVRRITLALGARALLNRQAKLKQAQQGTLPQNDQWVGKRIAVTVDGGRARSRIYRRGRRLANGRRRFATDWCEPKMLSIYEIDENGKKVGKPVYDGTLGGWKDLLRLVIMHLKRTGGDRAREIVFIGDGGSWIWSVQRELFALLPVPKKQAILDFYHASGYLWQMIDKATRWSEGQKKKWFKKHRRLLKKGRVDRILSSLQVLKQNHRGWRRKKISNAIDYFTEHHVHMHYHIFKDCGMPTGSGAIESALRQVVNLRLKSAGTFWLPENAEKMLVLRCALKSGRWDELVQEVLGEDNLYLLPQARAA